MLIVGLFKGEVIKYDVTKGFGFVKITHFTDVHNVPPQRLSAPMDDAFVHYREIEEHSNQGGIAKLEIGEVAEFFLEETPKGYSVKNLKVVGMAQKSITLTYDDFNNMENDGGKSDYKG